MKRMLVIVGLVVSTTVHGANKYFVDCTQPDNSGNGLSAENAKRTIQSAVDAATAGDTIQVAPGVYNEGSTLTPVAGGTLHSRLVCEKDLTIESSHGAEATIIQGAFDTGSGNAYGLGPNAVRCVYMSDGTLKGFTITGGATDGGAENDNTRGGGLFAKFSYTPSVYDCIVSNNAATRGGGTYLGAFHRCLITKNYASNNGAGVRQSTLYDCLITFNNGSGLMYCGRTAPDEVVNCTIARNTGLGLESSGASNSIIAENGNKGGNGKYQVVNCVADHYIGSAYNIDTTLTDDAGFVNGADGDFRLLPNSVALDFGNPEIYGAAGVPAQRTDVYGNPRVQGAGLNVGAIEGAFSGAVVTVGVSGPGTITSPGTFILKSLPTQLVFTATATAGAALRHFEVSEGKMKDCGDTFTLRIKHPGAYNLRAVFLPVRYVDPAGDDSADGETPASAWRTLQYAADTTPSGSMILAAPGVYAEGHGYSGSHSNRVALTRAVVLKASAGAEQTVIMGKRDPMGNDLGCGPNSMRCAYIGTAGSLEGFTLTGGASGFLPGDADGETAHGGGIFAVSPASCWDCVISNNVGSRGSASWGGNIYRSLVTDNQVSQNTTLRNTAVYDSLIFNNTGNYAACYSGSKLYNCTLTGQNQYGMGQSSSAFNSIIYNNIGGDVVHASASCENCCTGDSLRPGEGNIVADPLFVDEAENDYRLLAVSPCVNAGSASFGTGRYGTDYAGTPRWLQESFNIGAFEGSIGSIIATNTSGGAITPAGVFLLTNDLIFTVNPWPGREFRHFETNGVIVAGSGSEITIPAAGNESSAISLRAVFQDGYYVDATNGDDANSGLEPELPLKNIQSAVDLSLDGDTVRVASGVYQSGGGQVIVDGLRNRLVITNNITVTALDGAESTFIVGARSSNPNGCGIDAVRCVYMSTGTLEGFTVTGGATDDQDGGYENDSGGGIFTPISASARVIDCVISNNIAYLRGGGTSMTTLHRCWIENNDTVAFNSFGACVRGGVLHDCVVCNESEQSVAAYAYLYNCTVVSPALVAHCHVRNSILFRTTGGDSYYTSGSYTVYNSCLSGTLNSANDGGRNIFVNPRLINVAAKDFRLHSTSPCIDAGITVNFTDALGLDYTGAPRLQGAQVDMGAYEGGLGGGLYMETRVEGGGDISPAGSVVIETLPAEQLFTATPWAGREFLYFSINGVPVPYSGNTITVTGESDLYVALTAHFAGTLYADASKPDDSGDGTTEQTAKRTLQAAVALTTDYDTVLVAPGIYDEGSAVTPDETTTGYLLNRVVVTNNITLRSRDGATATVIKGAFDTTTSGDIHGRGPEAVRCVYISQGVLEGFTLTGGATDAENLENENNRGGGMYAPTYDYTPQIRDCVITNNASVRGGGTHAGTLHRCYLSDNYASENSSAIRGSLAFGCLVVGNRIDEDFRSTCAYATLSNCTIADNQGRAGERCTFKNSILSGGVSSLGYHYDCCLHGGTRVEEIIDNCFYDDPQFVNAAGGDYRLSYGSPCIDRAQHDYLEDLFGTDLTGDLRMQNARVDLGAYEYNWRPLFAAALDGKGIGVTAITPFVSYVEDSKYMGGSAVYLDGAAAQANGFDSVSISAPWQIPYGRTIILAYEVTGTGTLRLYDGAALIDEKTAADGAISLKYTPSASKPFPLRFEYTVGASETGGAVLDNFEGTGGMLLMLR